MNISFSVRYDAIIDLGNLVEEIEYIFQEIGIWVKTFIGMCSDRQLVCCMHKIFNVKLQKLKKIIQIEFEMTLPLLSRI